MAPFTFTLATATTTSSTFFPQTPSQQRTLKPHANQTHRFKVSCNAPSDDQEKPLTTNPNPKKLILPNTSLDLQNVDRRNLLVGLGGLYGTVNLPGLPSAFAEPIKAPSFFPSCKDAGSGISLKNGIVRTTACCPPASRKPEVDYVLPKTDKIRERKPIHKLSPLEQEKFKRAIETMRSLPDDDPRSFKNQAKVHCAYCNGSYTQNGQELQIHNSWLFFPFHRWYLYFYERILGHLIDDETFGLPYWNWDDIKDGMEIPEWIVKGGESNPLYDMFRNPNHLNGVEVDLDYQGFDRNLSKNGTLTQVEINQITMYRQMMRNAFDSSSFFGGKYVAGNEPISMFDNVVGSVESGCHTAVHRWVGDPNSPNNEDMGNFYSAGYDPLFYMHHSNVDRMWSIWKTLGKTHTEPKDEDWRNASYVFYDENRNAVRVYNKDCVDLDNGNSEKFRYKYEDVKPEWSTSDKYRPKRRCPNLGNSPSTTNTVAWDMTSPLPINKTVSVRVNRPDPKNKKEILCLKGINFDGEKFVKFDVLVNDCGDPRLYSPCDSEFAGSFAAIPHKKGMSMMCNSGARFSLTELFEEIKIVAGATSIRVTIVPRTEGKDVSIDGISIESIDI